MTLLEPMLRFSAQRWLNGIDLRLVSPTEGCADRDYWAWKVKDFPNGTLQGGLAGLLDSHDLLDLSEEQLTNLCRKIVIGTESLQRSNGSFEEAYPLESSYAVTGLVCFYLKYSQMKYPQFFSKEINNRLEQILNRAILFLEKTPETHGVISNHIATSELAIWMHTGEQTGVQTLLQTLNEDAWFIEYEGADPGYQSLLLHYFAMADSIEELPSEWRSILEKAGKFCSYFFMNDGSYSGEIGARGTAIYYPAACKYVGYDESWMKQALSSMNQTLPLSSDSGNFVPIFNSWAFFYRNQNEFPKASYPMIGADFKVFCKKAKLFVCSNQNAKIIVSGQTGAIRKLVMSNEAYEDQSFSSIIQGNEISQSKLSLLEDQSNSIQVRVGLADYQTTYPNWFTTILLRSLGAVTYFFPFMQRLIKKALAQFVMKKANQRKLDLRILIDIENPLFPIEILNESSKSTQKVSYGYFDHMASANTFEKRGLNNDTTI